MIGTTHTTGVLYDASTAHILGRGRIENAYLNDDARLEVRKQVDSWGSVGTAWVYDRAQMLVSDGTVSSVDVRNQGSVQISGGSVGSAMGDVRAFNESRVRVSGGGVYRLLGYDAASVLVAGGNTRYLDARDSSRVVVTGGDVGTGGYFVARNASTATIRGGSISTLWATDTSRIVFNGSDFRITGGLLLDGNRVLGTGVLTGKWFDGISWATTISTNHSTATVLLDPEPDSDDDGVKDRSDQCPDTIPGLEVDADGCPPLIRGDFDRDGDVDGVDVDEFTNCGSGPAVAFSAGCETMDFDGDHDVDQEDFGVFQACISGEDIPGHCSPPPGMVLIPAGEFLMGNSFSSSEGDADELPRHGVFVSAFYMDHYEVTNQQYAQALNWANSQGGHITVTSGVVYKYNSGTIYPYCSTTSVPNTSLDYGQDSRLTWNGSTFGVVAGKENHPMLLVSWYGAVAYANWRGGMEGKPLGYDLSTWACNFNSGYRLPTEAEWEKAARGGAAGRRFPWSDQDTIQHARASYYSSSSYSYDTSPTRNYHPLWGVGGYPFTSPVGFFNGTLRQKADFNWPGSATSYQTANGANGYGLYDMAGNVWEWCNDWYGSSYYSSSPSNNSRGPTSGSYRVLRGGGWGAYATMGRVADRVGDRPDFRYDFVGFRCAAGT